MITRFTSTLLIGAMLSLNVAQAAANFAEISSIQGKVLVNQGKGFVALAEGASLKAGDRVLVGKGSGAVIAYANGCAVNLNEPKIVTVAKVAPCKAGAKVALAGSSLISPVADVMVPAAGFPLPLLLIGGAAVGVGVFVLLKGPKLS